MNAILDRSAAMVINHLLAAAPWAKNTLRAHAGKAARFSIGGVDTTLTVDEAGMLKSSAIEATPDVTIQMPLFDALRLASGDESARRSAVVAGDARFANDIWRLTSELKWDAEEDLSRVMGDIAAHRLVSSARAITSWARDSALRVESAYGEYATEEARLLPPRAEVDQWLNDVDLLRDDVERLELRIARLESGRD